MTAQAIAALAAAILSLLFSYVPLLNTKFAELATEVKQLIMLTLILLVSAVSFGVACYGAGDAFGISWVCDQAGFYEFLKVVGSAIVANQGTFLITPQTNAVRAVK